jgi:cobalt-zinc-cadmium efflux system outer membrane protein
MTIEPGPVGRAGSKANRAGDVHGRGPAHIVVPVIVAAAIIAASLGGCAGAPSGADILEDLAEQGLLLPNDEEPPFSSSPSSLAEPDPLSHDTITIQHLLCAADRFNPRIGAARAAVGVAAGVASQASLYPNPSVEFEAEDVPLSGGGLDESTTTIGVVQPIIVSDRRSAAAASGLAEQRARGWDLGQTRRAVFGDVRRQVAEILYLRDAIRLRRDLLVVAGQTLEIAETRFDARAAPESEVIRSRVEADGLALSINRLERELAAAGERLNALLGGREVLIDRFTISLASTGPVLELEWLEQAVEERHPSVLAANERVKGAEHHLQQARAGRHPDIAARVAYGYDGAFDEHIMEVGLILPLTLFDRNQGNILRARYEVIVAKEQGRVVLNDLRADLADAYQRYMSGREQVTAFENRIVTPAQRSLAQAREGYTAGKLAFLDLLDAQRTSAGAQIARLGLLRELNTAQADLYGIVGEALDSELPGDHLP